MALSQISLLAESAISVMTEFGSWASASFSPSQAGLFHAADFAQELVDAGETHAGDDALEADAAVVFFLEKTEQVDLVFIARGVVDVAAFRGVGDVGAAVPHQIALAEPGAGGDEGAIADLAGIALGEGVNLVRGSSATP